MSELSDILTLYENTISPKSRLIALLLVATFGAFGAHRFYVGKKGTAIAQLVLTISIIGLVVSGIWALVDFIIVLMGEFQDKDRRVLAEWEPWAKQSATIKESGDIAEYASLRDKGLITEEEFEAKKAEILRGNSQ